MGSVGRRGRRASVRVAIALTVAVLAVVVPSTPASAQTPPPPDNRPVVAYGHLPGFCTEADPNPFGQSTGALYGWAWAQGTGWTQVPTCVFKWGNIGLSQASVAVSAGGVATFSLADSAAAPYIPTAGGARWQVGSPSRIVSGCGFYDVSCSFRVGTAGQDPPNWTYEIIQLSAPSSFVTQPIAAAGWQNCSPTNPCAYLQTNVWGAVAVRPGNVPPTASFTATPDTTRPGTVTFSSDSTDPRDEPLLHEWDFGDGTTATGPVFTQHSYARPGDYTATLKVTNQQRNLSDTTTRSVAVPAPTLALGIELLDGVAPPLDEDRPVRARVTASASSDGAGPLQGIRFDGGSVLRVAPGGLFTVTDGPDPAPPAAGFDLQPGERRSFEVELTPQGPGRYTLSSAVSGTDAAGRPVQASAEERGEVGSALTVELQVDPPTIDQAEGPDGPEPVDAEVTVTLRNTSGSPMTDVRLTSLRVDRTRAGQQLAVEQTGGVDPGDDGHLVGDLAVGEERKLTATFRATDDAEVEFSALATAALPGGASVIGAGRVRWSVLPQYFLGLTTEVQRPSDGALLPAGETIRVSGTVKNLTTTATVEVAPLYPELAGNAGVMSFTWDPAGRDPRDLVAADTITLEPGESVDFSVRVLTSWSDPRRIEGDHRHGGTWAELRFTPWGRATLEDGTEEIVRVDRVKASEDHLRRRVSIDDSIEIPPFDPRAFGGAIMVGGVEGVWNGTAATLWGVVELAKLPYTTLRATAEFQSQVWDSFSEAEKQAFVDDVALGAAAVLMRNVELGVDGIAPLTQKVREATLRSMTDMANDWETGDYTRTAQRYAALGSDAITQVVLPTALAKMAKSPTAAAALARAQEAVQSRMAPVMARIGQIKKVQEVRPVLMALESGTELLPEQLAVLYGITPEELTELQKLSDKYNFLLTVRSRHESSIEWIQRFGALLKPEKIKIKSVSQLDAKLGYRPSDLGSLVFKKPEPLITFEARGGDFDAIVEQFVKSKGFVEGTGDYRNAVARIHDRTKEWRKHEKTYRQWNERGWIDVTFNYEGNAVFDGVRPGLSDLGVAPLETGKYVGFRLRSIGTEEYVVEMFRGSTGRWVPVTGDIDPIAFTHLDGSPLTEMEHAALLDDLRTNPLLQSQHPESTTFVDADIVGGGDGRDFVLGQFKPNEPGLQIAPGGHLPRVVRLNKDQSRWVNPRDYHMHWDGGFVYSGTYLDRGSRPLPTLAVPPADLAPAPRPQPIPRAVDGEPNVGRCRVTFSTDPGAKPVIFNTAGRIAEVGDDGLVTQSDLHGQCFGEGPPVEVAVMPVTGALAAAAAGAARIEIPEGPDAAHLAAAGAGLAAGQTVVVGAGGDDPQVHTISGFGSILLDRPLARAIEAGELVLVVEGAPRQPPTTVPPTTVPPTLPPGPAPSPTVAGPSTGSGAVDPGTDVLADGVERATEPDRRASGAPLALTGSDPAEPLVVGVGMVLLGLLFIGLVRRHPTLVVRSSAPGAPPDDG